jgi:hypothetical protein
MTSVVAMVGLSSTIIPKGADSGNVQAYLLETHETCRPAETHHSPSPCIWLGLADCGS